MDGLLRNRDHQGQRHTITVSHNVTIFVPEPRNCPEMANSVTNCDWMLGLARSCLPGGIITFEAWARTDQKFCAPFPVGAAARTAPGRLLGRSDKPVDVRATFT